MLAFDELVEAAAGKVEISHAHRFAGHPEVWFAFTGTSTDSPVASRCQLPSTMTSNDLSSTS